MYDCMDPSQFEEKYGGKQPNRKEYWYFYNYLGLSKFLKESTTRVV